MRGTSLGLLSDVSFVEKACSSIVSSNFTAVALASAWKSRTGGTSNRCSAVSSMMFPSHGKIACVGDLCIFG